MIAACPKDPDETAECLYLGSLDSTTAQAFTTHMTECVKCREVYETSVAFVGAIRGAAKVLRGQKSATVTLP